MRSDLVPAAAIPSSLREPLAGWLRQVFGETTYAWAPPEWCVLVYDSPEPGMGELVSYLEIVRRTCSVGGERIDVGGIGGVMTRPEWRHRGFASEGLLRAAGFLRDELQVDFGLLVCDAGKIPFYGRAGWHAVDAPLAFDQPGGRTGFHEPTTIMVLPCRRSGWPAGEIDLCGLPW
jgi:GNAT superfamily N-acetyltransferase